MKFLKIAAIATLALSAICASAQVYQGKMVAGTSDVLILATVIVKKGEGCTQATKRTDFPLTEMQCLTLLEKWGRYQTEFESPLMMTMVKGPVMYSGDEMHYVFDKNGNGWVLQPR